MTTNLGDIGVVIPDRLALNPSLNNAVSAKISAWSNFLWIDTSVAHRITHSSWGRKDFRIRLVLPGNGEGLGPLRFHLRAYLEFRGGQRWSDSYSSSF